MLFQALSRFIDSVNLVLSFFSKTLRFLIFLYIHLDRLFNSQILAQSQLPAIARTPFKYIINYICCKSRADYNSGLIVLLLTKRRNIKISENPDCHVISLKFLLFSRFGASLKVAQFYQKAVQAAHFDVMELFVFLNSFIL